MEARSEPKTPSKAAKLLKAALRPLLIPPASLALRVRAAKVTNIGEALDLAFGFRFAGIEFMPWQVRAEIHGLLELIEQKRARVILEIGTARGGNLFLLARAAAPDALIISVDLPGGEFGGGYPRSRGILYRSFARGRQRIELLRGDSHDEATLSKVRETLGGRDVDVLFIDGDHEYSGVKRDFEMYSPLVSPEGIIAFHDIAPPPGVPPGGGVEVFWAEVQERHPVKEFLSGPQGPEDWPHGNGIGVLEKATLP